MIIGIIAINIAARTGHTALLTKPAEIPVDMAQGIQWDPDKQKSMGKETTINSSIESLTFHLAIILAVCGVSYILMNLVKQYKVPIINQIPIWPYALVVMFAVNFIIQKAGLGRLIDSKTKSRIAGCCSDYAITAAIASMPVQAILPYIVPIMIMVIGCYLFTFITIFVMSRKVFADCWFERGIAMWGTSTGVFLSGLMLLKICDPDYKLPALNDFSVGFSLTSITGFIMLPILVGMFLTRSFAFNLGFQLIMLAAYSALLIVFYFIGGRNPTLAKRSAA
jgi:ESS family glutamate:Na+ symporter